MYLEVILQIDKLINIVVVLQNCSELNSEILVTVFTFCAMQ